MAEGPIKPVTNPVLVDAMATFKVDLTNHDHEKAFLQAATEAKYLIPAHIEPPAQPPKEGEPTQARVAFQIMTNQNGDKFMPAFTDEIELRKNRKPGERFHVMVMSFMDLYRFMKANEGIGGMVINPFGSNLCLIRQQIIAIGDHGCDLDAIGKSAPVAQAPVTPAGNGNAAAPDFKAAQQAIIRQAMADLEASKASEEETPAVSAITDELLGALKAQLKKHKAVKKAYIEETSESNEHFLLIALEADESTDIAEIGNTLSAECCDYTDLPFDCVAATSIRAKELVNNNKPFYEKKRFGFF